MRAASWVGGRAIRAHYAGASTSRLFYDWAVGILSPDMEMRGNLPLLRARARELVRNNSYIAGFALAAEENIIGADGILLQAKIKDGEELDTEANLAIEKAWKDWCNPENCSLDGRDSFTDIERILARGFLIDGELIVRKIRGAPNDYGFAVQIIDPDMLDDAYDVPPDADGVEIRMGVEVSADGKPLAYHFWTRHPSEIHRGRAPKRRERVPADQIIHRFIRTRTGQTRGVTALAPILADMKMLAGYAESELVAARMQAAQCAVIVAKGAEHYVAPKSGSKPEVMEMEPGVVGRLNPGEELQMFDPTHPTMAFKEFVGTMLRGIARGLGISYLTLTGDLSAANYSSMRAGLLPERDHWRALQRWMSVHVHRVIYREWIQTAKLSPALRTAVAGYALTDLHAVEWKPRGWKWVDPKNDLTALEMEIALGINSRQRGCAERGVDFEEVVDEIAYEEKYALTKGVDVSGMTARQEPEALPPADENSNARALALVAGGAR